MTYCKRCGVELPPGSLKYLVTIHVTADFDGVLPAQAEMEDLEAFMKQVDSEDPGEPEKDVYQSQGYLVCPACKTAVLGDPLGIGSEKGVSERGGRMH